MEILIPSKNIYHKKNSKILTNQINSVEIGCKNVGSAEHDNKIFEYISDNEFDKGYSGNNGLLDVDGDGATDTIYFAYAKSGKYREFDKSSNIKISKKISPQGCVRRLILNENNGSYATVRIFGEKRVGTATQTFKYTFDGRILNTGAINYTPTKIENNVEFVLPTGEIRTTNNKAEAIVTLPEYNNLRHLDIQETDNEYIIGRIRFVASIIEITKMQATYQGVIPESTPATITLSGTYESYDAKRVEISFNGTVVELSLTDNTIVYGNGEGGNNYALDSNELVQNTSTIDDAQNTEFVAENIRLQYSNGKELATITCSIDDYYKYDTSKPNNKGDKTISQKKEKVSVAYEVEYEQATSVTTVAHIYITEPHPHENVIVEYTLTNKASGAIYNGTLDISAISNQENVRYAHANEIFEIKAVYKIARMTFAEQDRVIPMVLSPMGVDVPMSLNKDGTPKIFTVVGAEIFYDGSVMQKIYLQEI